MRSEAHRGIFRLQFRLIPTPRLPIGLLLPVVMPLHLHWRLKHANPALRILGNVKWCSEIERRQEQNIAYLPLSEVAELNRALIKVTLLWTRLIFYFKNRHYRTNNLSARRHYSGLFIEE
ncbi:hypothetical protein AVEN_61248-1 [Araneus ventricosus]|uniref:Uncharacterized protein n=1 Tax=Araneus ventricosus TaxID=182803 RepID=A0A4Y2NAN3_ARAVE|nr:hypothetical protein AVEN_61248-1 [Araneus ventricosus]